MTTEERFARVRKALEENQVCRVKFNNDGSGASFYYLDPTADHGCPCWVERSFDIKDAIRLLSGISMKQY